jgi:hypothetical protein
MKKDSTVIGLTVGLIAPLIVMFIFWQINFGKLSFDDFSELMLRGEKLSGLISVGLLGNLAAFFGFYRSKLDVSARGVILATFLYGAVIVYIKFLA